MIHYFPQKNMVNENWEKTEKPLMLEAISIYRMCNAMHVDY